jgi:hypothetical protein
MMRFADRRRINVVTAAVLVTLIVALDRLLAASLLPAAFLSGWTLLAIVVLLAAYNVRKRLTFLPAGASSLWLQVHVYAGLVSIAVFAAHVRYGLPRGGLEWTLFLLYAGVAGSGVAGLVVTRTFPPRLNTRGENVIFERIPRLRRRLREEAESIVLASVETGNVTTISDLYRARLLDFFAGPRHLWHHAVGSARPRHDLLRELGALHRYLSTDDAKSLERLTNLVELKDDLDYRHARFTVLRGWLFVHIPLTYALLIVMLVHVVVVHAYGGGLW